MQKLIFTRLTDFWVSSIIVVFFSLVINKVHDIPGYEVGTLFNEVGKADTQKVESNPVHLSSGIGYASGVYFYKLQSASFVISGETHFSYVFKSLSESHLYLKQISPINLLTY